MSTNQFDSRIFLIDTNVRIDIFILPESKSAQDRRDRAAALLFQVESGDVLAIVPEVVLHECFYMLVMRTNIMDVPEFATNFRSILGFAGCVMGKDETSIYLRALDILGEHPRVEFSDAVIAARAEAHGATLATFDKRLADAYGGPRWSDS